MLPCSDLQNIIGGDSNREFESLRPLHFDGSPDTSEVSGFLVSISRELVRTKMALCENNDAENAERLLSFDAGRFCHLPPPDPTHQPRSLPVRFAKLIRCPRQASLYLWGQVLRPLFMGSSFFGSRILSFARRIDAALRRLAREGRGAFSISWRRYFLG